MRRVTSCGVIVFRRRPELSFLLMRHANRWDLPKGHVEPGETEHECALREFAEETGLSSSDIRVQPGFQFETSYPVYDQRSNDTLQKRLVLFLAWLERARPITTSEHLGYEWVRWQPPHRIQRETIDDALDSVARYFVEHPY